MKLIIVLMTTVFLQVGLASEAQRVTLSEKNAPLESILKKIRIQTGYDFFGDINLIKSAKKVNLNVSNLPLEEVLTLCLKNQDLTFVISNKIIVIRKPVQSLISQNMDLKQEIIIHGKILDEEQRPLAGATLTNKRTKKSTKTDKNGEFSLSVDTTDFIIVSYIGYETREIKATYVKAGVPVTIRLHLSTSNLKQVEVVNTGYESLPKERATGSFQTITAKQLEHSTSPDLLKRLEGITTGLDFNNQLLQNPTNSAKFQSKVPTLNTLTIRGRNTLTPLSPDPNYTSGQPLVVIDGIPSPYSIDKLNPNDVESINILQDAAAASIWGSRAANGVIVVTTKKGSFETPTAISFDANLNITDKMDLFYRKTMSTSDYIDAQLAQLNYKYSKDGKTFDDPVIPNPTDDFIIGQARISPVAEIWNSWKKNRIDDTQYKNQIDALRNNDIRNDYTKYLLRNAVNQNYNLSASGGIKNYAYRLSGNYTKILNNTKESDANRMSINYNASIKPVKNLNLSANVTYNQQNRHEQGGITITGEEFFPYTRLVDDSGNPAVVPITYRPAFLDALNSKFPGKLLDMSFKPLDEIKQSYLKSKNQLLNLNLNAAYTISPVFSASVIYNNAWGLSEQAQLRGQNSFFMRDLINKFTNNSTFARVIPIGGLLIANNGKSNNQTIRAQLSANKSWEDKHELNAIAGVEGGQDYNNNTLNYTYGYNEQNKTVSNTLPFGVLTPLFFIDPSVGVASMAIPYQSTYTDYRVRTFSLYSNAAYTYDKRYTLSASIRDDYSSAFGEGTNEHGAIYFSTGAKWNINKEKFYHVSWLPTLGLKATFGYNGNVNASVSPKPLITYAPSSGVGYFLPFASTALGSNRDLRPEKAAMLNLGLNFGTKNNRITGNIEYYIRKTTNLIASATLDPTTGFSVLQYNAADLRGTGIDFSLNSLNLELHKFSWSSNFLFSNNRVKVTELFSARANTIGQQVNNNPPYNKGADLSRLYAYRWAGLDPATGDPMGYIDGKPVRVTGDATVYNQIVNAPAETGRYFGSAVPVYYGSFRNTFKYGNFAASLNFLYKLGYYFRRSPYSVVRYSQLFANNQMLQGAEYANRWQKPGDEAFTNVPSVIFPITDGVTDNRDNFYYNSEINVQKADHVRLQEINLSYTLPRSIWAIKSARIYANVNNLGIVWRANKLGIDPDIYDFPNPRTYSIGLSASF